MLNSISKSGDNILYFPDFLKFVLPKRYVITDGFTDDIIKSFYIKHNKEIANEIPHEDMSSQLGEIYDSTGNISYKNDGIVVKLSQKKTPKFDHIKTIEASHSTYWYISRMLEQELMNRKKLSTLVNIMSTTGSFSMLGLFNYIDGEMKGY